MVKRRYPIRLKLTIATLLPLSVAILICWVTGVSILTAKAAIQTEERVRTDLNAAREIYRSENEHIRDVVKFTAAAPYTADAIAREFPGRTRQLAEILVPLMKSEQLDLFTAVDARGIVRCRAHHPAAVGDVRAADPLVKRALTGEAVIGTLIIPARQLLLEGEDLAWRAAVPVPAAANDASADQALAGAGMLLVAAAPVRDRAGNIVGALYGGILLNNNHAFVDRIRKGVYEGSHEDAGSGGVAIALGDLRVATTVMDGGNRRAIGTRLPAEVHSRVVLRDEPWTGRTFQVNDWFLSACEPIRSLLGVPIGALSVGMPEKPYTGVKINVSIWFSAVLLLGSAIGLVAARLLSSRLAQPVKELETLARRVAAGERGVRISVDGDDELGDLADEFNRMSLALTRQEQEIRELNRGLEQKVQERTVELEEKNRLLQEAQQELVRVEKLAAIGELAAGVAHEINNPLAIIRGNNELLQTSLPTDSPDQEEVGIIGQQVIRMERIVANLLRFARQERKLVAPTPLNRLLDEILGQVGHQVPLAGIEVVREYDAMDPVVEADGDQLRQVFTNLILNAVQAMPTGGTLTVVTRVNGAARTCEVVFTDTGRGIAPENIGQIFNPFFTTRANGTGLGLSVSYGIVKDHGGDIVVESSPGSGSSFLVILHQQLPPHLRDDR